MTLVDADLLADGLCTSQQYQPEWWHVDNIQNITTKNVWAIAMCRRCPIQTMCRDMHANMARPETGGVIGGGIIWTRARRKGRGAELSQRIASALSTIEKNMEE